MATDIRLDEAGGSWIVLDCGVVKLSAADLMIDSPARRSAPGGFRRALVHDVGDALTINFGTDYPGGVQINGRVRIAGTLDVDGQQIDPADIALIQVVGSEVWKILKRVVVLEKQMALLVRMFGVAVPDWRTLEDVEKGDNMGLLFQSAETLGFEIDFIVNQNGQQIENPFVVGLDPPAGTLLLPGSRVTVTLAYVR